MTEALPEIVEGPQFLSEELWAMLVATFRQTPVAMVLASAPDGKVRLVNRALIEILGVEGQVTSAAPLLATEFQPTWRLVDAKGNELAWQDHPIVRALRGFTTRRAAFDVVRADGTRRAIEVDATPVHGTGDRVVAAIGSFADVTAEQETRQRLAHTEERYRRLVDQAADGILVGGPGGVILEANERISATTGFTREELCGRNISTLFAPDTLAAAPLRYDLLDGGAQLTRERMMLRKDGTQVPIEMNTVRISDGRYQAIVRDVSERRRVEEASQRANRLEAVGLLAGGIAHDFNNILTGILGNLSLARMGTNDPGLAEVLDGAERASLRARDLTNQLLTFAKGGVPIRRKTMALEDLLRESATFVLSGSRNSCVTDIAPDLWPTEIDSSQISRVFQNLVINADQAMPSGGEIRIRARNRHEDGSLGFLPPGRYIEVAIEDHGHGIPEALLPRIFEPYFTTRESGSGFGLPISDSIVRRHGGAIAVRSVPGQGSTFTVYLPAADGAQATAAAAPDAPAKGRGRVLVMDDQQGIRDLLLRALPALGYEADAVPDGETAVARYRDSLDAGRPYDVVLVDLTIPGGLGGLDATARLRALNSDVRVLVSSGYCDDPVMADHRRFGFCGVLEKPYRMDRLALVLAAALQRPPPAS